MNIINGSTRRVYLGAQTVIKVPIIKPSQAKWMVGYLPKRFSSEFKKTHDLKLSVAACIKASRSFAGLIGVFENWHEMLFSRKLGDLVVPIRLSLPGLFNIMDRGTTCRIAGLGREFIDGLRHYGILDHTHTFENPDHFVWHKGKIKICDYGSFGTAMFLLENKKMCRAMLDQIAENYLASLNPAQPAIISPV